MDFSLFGRYFLDLAIFYPGAFLCLAPLWEHVKAPRRTAVLTAALVTVICLAAAALCAIFELDSNILLLPTLLAAFWLLRWRVGPEVSVSQTAFLFAVSCVMMAVCTLLSAVLNARAEVGNDAPACLVSTSLIKLGLSAVLCIIFWFTAVQWSRWLLQEYRGEAFWQSAWQVKVMARMLSPAMLGLLVENRYDGVLKRQQGTLHSTKHDGMGIGLVSIQTAVSRYGGSMTVETENGLFRVNILLNL